jgi:lysophospholipase L1-like esterase
MVRLKYFLITIVFFCFAHSDNNLRFYPGEEFMIEGKGETVDSSFYRLPTEYKNKVRKPVWDLAKNSAGLSIGFLTDSKEIEIKWSLLNNFQMNHMAGTGIRGVDLYCKKNDKWHYIKTAIPREKENHQKMIKNLSGEMMEYKLYLSLYDGIAKIEIGIDSVATILPSEKDEKLPIIFYGTSITQGGCASRPGMAYTNIISRQINRDCINLGFSGNGRMEPVIAQFISQFESDFIVVDCLPNMTADMIVENLEKFVKLLRTENNEIPIIFLENIYYTTSYFDFEEKKMLDEKNNTLRDELTKLQNSNIKNLHVIPALKIFPENHEGTVDGVHFTDFGFQIFSDSLVIQLKNLGLID